MTTWQATALTLFPEMFPGSLGCSLAGRALREGIWSMETQDLRNHGVGRHRNIDDTPFGGGAGMVMRPDVVSAALEDVDPAGRPVIYPTPRGRTLTQSDVRRYASGPGVVVLCGRYEGVDERVLEARDIEQVSIGDYILSGGEVAALVLLDACVRLLPGVMGSDSSATEESFSGGLLEYPHYTRPARWEGHDVPDVLLSGDHGAIARWRHEMAEMATRQRRPDLWAAYAARAGEDISRPAGMHAGVDRLN
ncbi:tRNA (guanosine(37)-N1)-methyltransferase TrmD [Novacetimonas pomaceti]|uniref:tRNA (guanine-N(1)-)-methyltransferase n=1 Tax=Novacetimonas pomaceti TaxID=2021998 RepID=A0ABX5P1N3_9PROT|nr:tRNA (guanosine(37)-N1)-methyltransferase TrmD [Novacetimonas pomaceti]PYD47662.1 tRNA (guanosine(37)-N1)-methyltransferase TrmD [Novacetimonas pomaceti]